MNPLASASACHGCANRGDGLIQLGVTPGRWDYLVALAGNPNTGKSTVFNALTGLRQHTGNWPGKTVARAEGTFRHGGKAIKVVDLPGTYSLQAASADEEVARDFLLFGRPDVTVVVIDATRLERNLNLALQVLEVTDRVVVVLNLMDEARRHGIGVSPEALARELGVPVIAAAARQGTGIRELREAILQVATGAVQPRPHRLRELPAEVESAIAEVLPAVEGAYPESSSRRWLALRLLNGDERVVRSVPPGELAAKVVETRWRMAPDFQDRLSGALYAEAERIARASEVVGLRRMRVDLDKHLDRLLTSRWTGLPLMVLLLAVVFWLTIAGANVPSSMLASLLIDGVHPVLKGFGAAVGMPWWLSGFIFDGMYLATAWVVSRHAAADGDLLPAVHAAGGFRLPAAGRLQPGPDVPAGGRARQAGADDVHGIRLQCRRGGGHPRHRLAARAAGRHHHQQLLAVQRALADADPDRQHLHRHAGSRAPRRDYGGRRRRRHRAARRVLHVPGVVGPDAHRAEGRGDHLLSRASAVSAASGVPDPVHVAGRPHGDRAVAGGRLRTAGGRR